jgi:hypothetical protein
MQTGQGWSPKFHIVPHKDLPSSRMPQCTCLSTAVISGLGTTTCHIPTPGWLPTRTSRITLNEPRLRAVCTHSSDQCEGLTEEGEAGQTPSAEQLASPQLSSHVQELMIQSWGSGAPPRSHSAAQS